MSRTVALPISRYKSTPAEVSALESGAVDAIVTQPPTDTSQYIDNSFVDSLQQSGFIDSLYKK